MKWFLIFALLTTPAAAVSVCDQTGGRGVWFKWRAMSQLLTGLTYRKQCGVVDSTDKTAIASIYTSRGCAADTKVGRYFTAIFNQPITEENEHPGLAVLEAGNPVAYYQVCKIVQALDWPQDVSLLLADRGGLSADALARQQSFWAHLDAVQSEITWALKQ